MVCSCPEHTTENTKRGVVHMGGSANPKMGEEAIVFLVFQNDPDARSVGNNPLYGRLFPGRPIPSTAPGIVQGFLEEEDSFRDYAMN